MCSYHAIMNFSSNSKVPLGHLSPTMHKEHEGTNSFKNLQRADSISKEDNGSLPVSNSVSAEEPTDRNGITNSMESRDDGSGASSSGSSWFQLRSDATIFVSQTLLRGRMNLWQLIIQTATNTSSSSQKPPDLAKINTKQSGFSHWINTGDPFSLKIASKKFDDSLSAFPDSPKGNFNEGSYKNNLSVNNDVNHSNGHGDLEDENEDLHADFIDEDSQLPSRISKPNRSRNHSSPWSNEEMEAHTGSSICVLRVMDKYARLMQRLDIFFKGICQHFGIFFHFVFISFGRLNTNPSGKGLHDTLNLRLKTTLSRIRRDYQEYDVTAISG